MERRNPAQDAQVLTEEESKKIAEARKKKDLNSVSVMCARKMLQGVVELRILMGDIITEEAEGCAFPADKDLSFKQSQAEKSFKYQIAQLMKMFSDHPDKRVVRFANLKLDLANKVYFCKIPTWMGGMSEREEFNIIIKELFDLANKDGVKTLAIYPLNRKMGSFPLRVMARQMLYYLDHWVFRCIELNQKDRTSTVLSISSIKIVCPSHPIARAFCTELYDMGVELTIGGFDTRGMRRLSEELVDTINPDEPEKDEKAGGQKPGDKFFSSVKKK
jgi:hypothetical protein